MRGERGSEGVKGERGLMTLCLTTPTRPAHPLLEHAPLQRKIPPTHTSEHEQVSQPYRARPEPRFRGARSAPPAPPPLARIRGALLLAVGLTPPCRCCSANLRRQCRRRWCRHGRVVPSSSARGQRRSSLRQGNRGSGGRLQRRSRCSGVHAERASRLRRVLRSPDV